MLVRIGEFGRGNREISLTMYESRDNDNAMA